MPDLKVVSEYQPAGDQPQAIDKLAQGLENGLRAQVLKGVTGSGKTYTMAKVIERVNRPTLVLAHNKTLAAQLCEEFREFFPNNAVEYFVSYYDYYQPEAYVPQTDTYIEKDASTNEEIDRLRLSATCALLERRDVIVVASVSCIYGLGEPDDFARMMISLRTGMTLERDELLRRLVEDRYERNDVAFQRNVFRVRGDTVELYPAYYKDRAIRVEFFGDEIERITEFHPVTGAALKQLTHVAVYPASHYVTPKDKLERAGAGGADTGPPVRRRKGRFSAGGAAGAAHPGAIRRRLAVFRPDRARGRADHRPLAAAAADGGGAGRRGTGTAGSHVRRGVPGTGIAGLAAERRRHHAAPAAGTTRSTGSVAADEHAAKR